MKFESKDGYYVYKTENLDINHVDHLLWVFGLHNKEFSSSEMELSMVDGAVFCKFPKHIDSSSLCLSALAYIEQCDRAYNNNKDIWLKVFDNNVSQEVEHDIYKVKLHLRNDVLTSDSREGGIDLYFAFNPKYECYCNSKSKSTNSKMRYIKNYLAFEMFFGRRHANSLVGLTKLDEREKSRANIERVYPFNPHALLIRLAPNYQKYMREVT